MRNCYRFLLTSFLIFATASVPTAQAQTNSKAWKDKGPLGGAQVLNLTLCSYRIRTTFTSTATNSKYVFVTPLNGWDSESGYPELVGSVQPKQTYQILANNTQFQGVTFNGPVTPAHQVPSEFALEYNVSTNKVQKLSFFVPGLPLNVPPYGNRMSIVQSALMRIEENCVVQEASNPIAF